MQNSVLKNLSVHPSAHRSIHSSVHSYIQTEIGSFRVSSNRSPQLIFFFLHFVNILLNFNNIYGTQIGVFYAKSCIEKKEMQLHFYFKRVLLRFLFKKKTPIFSFWPLTIVNNLLIYSWSQIQISISLGLNHWGPLKWRY